MKKILFTLLGLGVLGTCQADILIYKIKVTSTVAGNGLTTKSAITGYVVIDLSTHELANIPVQSASFKIFEFTNASYAQVDTGKGKRDTALSFPGNGIGSVFATGLNSTLVTGTFTGSFPAPKTMKVTGNEISNNLLATELDSGTFIYDQVDTVTQNGSGGDFNATVANIQQTLVDRGFIELQ